MAYLDNSATTETDPAVISVMADVMKKIYGNPSSLHGIGVKAERLMEQARKVVADALSCLPHEIVFTSGGTEANNMVIRGVAEAYHHRGNHMITSPIEHPSVYHVFQYLKQKGWKITELPVDSSGRVNPADVETALTDETVLVSVMHVNNEVGTIQPVEEIGNRLKKYPKVMFHVDAVQSFGKIPLHPSRSHIDFLTISGHKLHGPKGIGCLYKRKNLTLPSLLLGGGQERGLRSGTENLPAIAGLAKAVLLAKEAEETFYQKYQTWKEMILTRIENELTGVKINGDIDDGGAPYILNLSFPGLKSEVIVHALEKEQVYVSSKSACSSKKEEPSRVLKAMGLTDQEALGSIRISMGRMNVEEDIKQCCDVLVRTIPALQKVMKVHKR
ncbi:cysteine desulfurase family protein [Thermoactinomyces mirandus]|uniref:cysteine desulfurase family protein n=1 Tax=Thermoactinomyces mirandus TaxID=2756294 RepID=UPI001FE68717|nr:cysteine desulfurase family protein [Thermoactinomyces mirandus]